MNKFVFFLLSLLAILPSSLQARTVEVGVLADFLTEDFKPKFIKLQNEIKAVVGNDAKIEFSHQYAKTNGFDSEVALRQYEAMMASEVDLILAFGPVNNEIITKQAVHRKPTILFGAVNLDVIPMDPSKKVSGTPNFTYLIAPLSYQKDLQAFKSIYDFKRVGVVGGRGPWNSQQTRDSLDKTFASLDASYKMIRFESLQQFERDIQDVDAVYLAEGFGIPSADIANMAQVLLDARKPSFSSSEELDVRNGWLATNQSEGNMERLFRRLALTVEAAVNGRKLSQRPVLIEFSDVLTMNYNTAETVGVPIKHSQLAQTNVVGDWDKLIVDESYTLWEAIELSLRNNLNLKAAEFDVELSESSLANAKTAYLPDVSASASQSWLDPDVAVIAGGQNPERVTSGSLGITQLIYSQDNSTLIGVRRSQLDAQQQSYESVRLDTVVNTTRAGINMLRRKNALRSQAENLEVSKRNLKVAEQNFDLGKSSKADIFRIQSELASNLQALIEASNGFIQAQHALNGVLNKPISTRVEIKEIELGRGGPLEPEEFGFERLQQTLDDPIELAILQKFMVRQALEISPDLTVLTHNLAAIERDLEQYGWKRYLPTVSASAQANHTFDRAGVGVPDPALTLDDDYNLGLLFSIPLFNRNLDNVEKKRAERQRDQLLLQIEGQKLTIETQVRDAVLDVSNRVANIELSAVSEQAAKQSLELIEASYANGAVTVTELIDAQNAYLQAQLASTNAGFDFVESAVQMERAVGGFFFLDSSQLRSEEFEKMYNAFRQEELNGDIK